MSTQSGSGDDEGRARPAPPAEPGQQGGWGGEPGPGQQGGWGGQPGQGSGQQGGWGGQSDPGSQGGWGGQPGQGSQGGSPGQAQPGSQGGWGGQSDPGSQGASPGQAQPGSQGGWGGQSDPGQQGGWGGQSDPGQQGGWGGQSDPGQQGGQGSGGWADPYGGQGAQTGWGGQPQPVGGYGYRQAEAPRPGPVPVRPMALGELLDAAFKLLRADFGPILLAVGAVVVPLQILSLVLTANFSTDLLTNLEQNPEAIDDLLGDFAALIPGIGLVAIVTFVLTLIAQGAVIRVGAARYLGGVEGAGDALRHAGRKAGRLIGVRILIGLMAFAPFIVLVLVGALLLAAGSDLIGGILLGLGFLSVFFAVYAFIRWYLVAPVIMLEDAGVRASMRRSGQLVSGNWWRLLGYLIVAGIILAVVSTAVSAVFSTLGGVFPVEWFRWVFTGIGAILAALVTEPVTALISLMLYADLRVRKEGLDIQLRVALPSPYQGGGAQFSPGASPG